MRYKKKLF